MLKLCNAAGGTPSPPPHNLGVAPRNHPAAETLSQEGYKEAGQDGRQFPTAEIPVPASQLLQKQLRICLRHGANIAHLSTGRREKKLPPLSQHPPRQPCPFFTANAHALSVRGSLSTWGKRRGWRVGIGTGMGNRGTTEGHGVDKLGRILLPRLHASAVVQRTEVGS